MKLPFAPPVATPIATAAVWLASLLAGCAAVEPTRPEAPPQPPAATAPVAPPQTPVVSAPPAQPPVAPAGRPLRTLRDAQQRLAELGYDPGVADGVAGAQTQAALRAFQSAHGLRPTGRMASPTREALEK